MTARPLRVGDKFAAGRDHGSSHVDVLNVLRRLTLVTVARSRNTEPDLTWPEFVDLYLLGHRPHDPHQAIRPDDRRPHWDPSTNWVKFVHHIAGVLGCEAKGIADYTPEQLTRVAAYAAKSIASRGPDGDASDDDKRTARERGEACPWWPSGWRGACARAIENERELDERASNENK